jgi:hypothetical protein
MLQLINTGRLESLEIAEEMSELGICGFNAPKAKSIWFGSFWERGASRPLASLIASRNVVLPIAFGPTTTLHLGLRVASMSVRARKFLIEILVNRILPPPNVGSNPHTAIPLSRD